MNRRPIYIYALLDPRSRQVRYVGQSIHPEARLLQHLERGWRSNPDLGRWVGVLTRRELRPELRILEECRGESQADQQEAHWIRKFRAEGADLLNRCDGAGRGITKAARVSRDEWMGVAETLRDTRRQVRALHDRLSHCAGQSSPPVLRVGRSIQALDQARIDLETVLTRHFPEWASELTEALYE